MSEPDPLSIRKGPLFSSLRLRKVIAVYGRNVLLRACANPKHTEEMLDLRAAATASAIREIRPDLKWASETMVSAEMVRAQRANYPVSLKS